MSSGTHDGLFGPPLVAPVARGNVCDSDRLVVAIEEHTRPTGVAAEVQVVLNIHDAVHVRSGGIATPASVTVDVLGPDLGTVRGLEVLDIVWSTYET